MLKRALVLAVIVLGAQPGLALAADDFRDGAVSDPAADASVVYDSAGRGARLVDVRSAGVAYDAGLGSVSVSFGGDVTSGPNGGLYLYATVSAPNEAGRCDGVRRVGDVRINASLYSYSSYVYLYDQAYNSVGMGTAQTLAGGGVRISGVSDYLIRRDLRCVSEVKADKSDWSSYSGTSSDGVSDFCIGTPSGTCPTVPPTPPPAILASGLQLTWSQVAGATSYVVATSLAPEGSEGRKTTYQTVGGTSFTPPAAPGTTRWYGVRANNDGALWAHPEAAITFPGSAPVTAPTRAPAIQASNGRLSWNKIDSFSSYVVATSRAPEGSSGRQTTYQVVTGTSFDPPAAPGSTRWYGVRVNVEGSLWAQPEASIAFSEAAPPPPPPPFTSPSNTPPPGSQGTDTTAPSPTPSATATTGVVPPGPGAGAPSVTPGPTAVAPRPKLSVTRAKTVARQALAKRYGRAFSLRKDGSFRIGCESLSASKVRCDLRWRYAKYSYAGTITVTRTASGEVWRSTIKRKTTKKR